MKLSEAIAEVIRLADARKTYWKTELPKRHPDYPLMYPGEPETPPPPEDAQLRDFMVKLPPEMLYKIITIMRLGRRDLGPDRLAEGYAESKRMYPDPDVSALVIAAKTPLGDYLRDGLTKLRESGILVDRLPLNAAKTRR